MIGKKKGEPWPAFQIIQIFRKSHVRIVRSIAALWRCPVDVLAWVFDVTCFAMHTVLEVDDKFGVFARFFNEFVHTGRAIPR